MHRCSDEEFCLERIAGYAGQRWELDASPGTFSAAHLGPITVSTIACSSTHPTYHDHASHLDLAPSNQDPSIHYQKCTLRHTTKQNNPNQSNSN